MKPVWGFGKEIKTDEIDKVEEWFKINIHIYTQDEKTMPKSTDETAAKTINILFIKT
jgi:hypothetical protein